MKPSAWHVKYTQDHDFNTIQYHCCTGLLQCCIHAAGKNSNFFPTSSPLNEQFNFLLNSFLNFLNNYYLFNHLMVKKYTLKKVFVIKGTVSRFLMLKIKHLKESNFCAHLQSTFPKYGHLVERHLITKVIFRIFFLMTRLPIIMI